MHEKTSTTRWVLLVLTVIFHPFLIRAQTAFVAGDGAHFYITKLDREFNAGGSISIDLDCDGQEDLNMSSFKGNSPALPWERLSFSMSDMVEVHNNGIGKVTPFNTGDTISSAAEEWTPFLDFIYGTGEAGMYGQYMLDHVYLAFRKINGDSSLCMLHFSSTGIRFTVHEIFVECPGEPVLSSVELVDPQVQPNPCTDWIQVTGSVWESLELLDIRGQLIRKESNVQWINTEELSPGIYFLKLKGGTAREQTLRFIKAL